MARRAAILFYAEDHLRDRALRSVSLAARGLWMDLLCLMHRSPRPGFLLHPNGDRLSAEDVARLAVAAPVEVESCLRELGAASVFGVAEDGTLFSRRMVRDERKRELCSDAGRRGGGSPSLRSDLYSSPLRDAFIGEDATSKGPGQRSPLGVAEAPHLKTPPLNVPADLCGSPLGETFKGGRTERECVSSREVLLEETSLPGSTLLEEKEKETNKEKERETGPASAAACAVDAAETAAARFERAFWPHVPAKIGKAAALRAYEGLSTPDRLAAEAGIEIYGRLCHLATTAGFRVLNPSTYLAERRWEDDVEALCRRAGVAPGALTAATATSAAPTGPSAQARREAEEAVGSQAGLLPMEVAPPSDERLWRRILARLEALVDERDFESWFRHARAVGETDGALLVKLRSPLFASFVRENFGDALRQACRDTGLAKAVEFLSEEDERRLVVRGDAAPARASPSPARAATEPTGRPSNKPRPAQQRRLARVRARRNRT